MGKTNSNSGYTATKGSTNPKSKTTNSTQQKNNTASSYKSTTSQSKSTKQTTNYTNTCSGNKSVKNNNTSSSYKSTISQNNSTKPTTNYTNTCGGIVSIKNNIDNKYRPTTNYNASYTNNGNTTETLSMFDRTKIGYDYFDLNMIAFSAENANNEKYSSVNEEIWKNADLNITQRDDGTFLIRNGDVPIGFTTKKGLSSLFKTEQNKPSSSNNQKYSNAQNNYASNSNAQNNYTSNYNAPKLNNNYTYNSNINEPYDPTRINLNEIDYKRLSATEEGAYTGNFTNLNLSAYKNSKINYKVNENGTVSIINNGKTIGYTDIFGISQDKNTKYNENSSPLMDYLVNTNANHSITSVGDLTRQYMRENIRSLDPQANIYGTQESLERFQELFPSIKSQYNPYVSSSEAHAQMETIEVPIWDGEKETTMNLTVHNKLKENYIGAFSELADMKYRVNPSTTAAFVYRSTQGTTGSGGRLSDHSFGGAFDLNWDVNPIVSGKNYNTSDRVITKEVAEVMNKYGFSWGGDWNGEKDYMHFSYTGG